MAELTDDVRRWYSSIGTGWRVFSSEKRSLIARMTAERRIATMRERYGPSLRRAGQGKRAAIREQSAVAWNGGELPPDWKPPTKNKGKV